MTENDHTSWEERLLAASPNEVRALAAGIPTRARVDDGRRGEAAPSAGESPEPQPAEPGPGDGGTSTVPAHVVNLETETDPRRVREAAKKIAEARRR